MGLILFTIYAVFLFILGGVNRQARAMSQERFFVNARKSSASAVAISIVTSCVGASATIGVIGLAFEVGWPAIWWLGSGVLGLIVLGSCLATRVRASESYTLSDIVATLLGKRAEWVISVIVTLAWTAIVAAQLTAGTFLIQALLDVERLTALILGCLLIALHTSVGGQAGIIRLDKFQSSIIMAGILTLLFWGMNHSPTSIQTVDFVWSNQQFPISKVIYFCLILGGSYVVCPMLYSRVLSAESEKAARNGVLIAALGLAIAATLIVLIGIYARGLIPPQTSADQVLITILSVTLPIWLAKLMYLFLLCVVVSSADSCLFAASSALSRHLLHNESVKGTRICTLFLMIIALLLTFSQKGILDYLLMANNIYVCSVVIPVMLCLLLKRSADSIHQTTVLCGILLAGFFGALSAFSDQIWLSYIGLACSLFMTIFSIVLPKLMNKMMS